MFSQMLAALLVCLSLTTASQADCLACRTPVRSTVQATAKVAAKTVDAVVVDPTLAVLGGVKQVVIATTGEVRSIVCKRIECRKARCEARRECRKACQCECEAPPFNGETEQSTTASTK